MAGPRGDIVMIAHSAPESSAGTLVKFSGEGASISDLFVVSVCVLCLFCIVVVCLLCVCVCVCVCVCRYVVCKLKKDTRISN